MSERVYVGDEEEIRSTDRKIIESDGTAIGVIYVDGDYHAFMNRCPHRGGPVGEGEILPVVEAGERRPGERVDEVWGDQKVITCPWHGWEFEVETGQHSGDEDVCLQMYDVLVEDGEVYVEK